MDKNTLSEYGWFVILIIILAIMLVVAQPVGNMVNKGLTNVANEFFPTNVESKQLDAPSVSIRNDVKTIRGEHRAEEFKIYVDDMYVDTVDEGEVDLTDYSWGSDEHIIRIVAIGDDYKSSDPSAELIYQRR